MTTRCTGTTKAGNRCKRTKSLDEFNRCRDHRIDADDDELGLTDKQRRFVEEYVLDFNATRAAIRAGYAESGASVEGSRLLANAKVKEALSKRFEALAMPAEEVVARLTDQARGANPEKLLRVIEDVVEDEDGKRQVNRRITVDLTSDEAREAWRLVKKIRFDRYGQPVVEMVDQQAALVHLGRIRNLFREQVDVTFVDARASRLREKAADLGDATDADLEELMEAYASGELGDEDDIS